VPQTQLWAPSQQMMSCTQGTGSSMPGPAATLGQLPLGGPMAQVADANGAGGGGAMGGVGSGSAIGAPLCANTESTVCVVEGCGSGGGRAAAHLDGFQGPAGISKSASANCKLQWRRRLVL